MSEDMAALLLALAEIADLRAQLAVAQDMLMETAIDAGRLHARIAFLPPEQETRVRKVAPADRRQVRPS